MRVKNIFTQGADEILHSTRNNKSYSKSTPSMSNCGTGASHKQNAAAIQNKHYNRSNSLSSSTSCSQQKHRIITTVMVIIITITITTAAPVQNRWWRYNMAGTDLSLSNQSTLPESDKIPKSLVGHPQTFAVVIPSSNYTTATSITATTFCHYNSNNNNNSIHNNHPQTSICDNK
ncbi:hypothetical protein EVAR_70809_1 [Eumeta japonica]|uniref:Uncharacterized protein n=1 Tax=Eumeta variegata TaxID=151549 RepID=A0A4C1SX53_EUMVA|nr:hypothetical protein EVAR_70809_1 [Eumeta japonica]